MQLSTGAADTAVIEDGAHTWVIDTGEHGGDLANYLLSRGRSVDTLYITHLHSDHVGGLQQLLEQRATSASAILKRLFEAKDVNWGPCHDRAAQRHIPCVLLRRVIHWHRGAPRCSAVATQMFTLDRTPINPRWSRTGILRD